MRRKNDKGHTRCRNPRRSPTEPSRSGREFPLGWVVVAGAVLVIAAGVATYANSLQGAFVFDDTRDIRDNPRIHHILPLWETLRTSRPIIDLTLAINYALGELNAWGYHVVNLVIHLLAGLTLLGVVRRTVLCGGFDDAHRRAAPWLALTISLLWVVHPLQTQSVVYTIQRSESLMGLFYLLTLYCVIRGAGSRYGPGWYAAAVVSCSLGMGSKAVMITAPAVVLLYDRVFLTGSFVQALRRRWGLYVGLMATWSVLVVSGVTKGVLNPSPKSVVTVGFGVKDITPVEYLLTQPGVILHYLRLSLWPHPLCLDYGWPIADTAADVVVPGIIVVALLAGTVWALWRKPWLGFLGAWFFIILSPTSSFIPVKDPIFEHRMYLSLAAIVAVLVAGGDQIIRYLCARWMPARSVRPAANAVLVALLAILLGASTHRRNEDYQSAVRMWEDVIAKRPQNARAHNNLGVELDKEGRYDEAVHAYREAIRLDPAHRSAYEHLGQTLTRQGKLEEALEALHRALSITPGNAKVYDTIGTVYGMQGKTDEAIRWFREAIRRKYGFAQAHYNLGTALAAKGQSNEAIEHFETALQLQPRYPDALVNLGGELRRKGLPDQAMEKFREALRFEPTHSLARQNLAYDLWRLGRTEEALEVYREGVRIQPRNADAHVYLGHALAQAGRLEEALKEYEHALRLRPDHEQARQARDAIRASLRRE